MTGNMSYTILMYSTIVSTLQVHKDLDIGAAGITPGVLTLDKASYSILSLQDLAK